MTTLYQLLAKARSPKDVSALLTIVSQIKLGQVIYTDEFGDRMALPEAVKQSALRSLKTHIDVLKGHYKPGNEQDYEIKLYWHYLLDLPCETHNPLDAIGMVETKKIEIQRKNDFNICLELVIKDFILINGYPPSTIAAFEHLKNKTPKGFAFRIDESGVSIKGGTPKSIKSVKQRITKLLKDKKSQSDD